MQVAQVERCQDNMALRIHVMSILAGFDGVSRATADNLMSILTCSQGGSGGKWQTPHQKSKASTPRGGGKIEPGDAGIWATCMKSKEGKATEELKSLFEHVKSRSTNWPGTTNHLSSPPRSSTTLRL